MVSLKGNCQRCGNYDPYLRKVESKWLCIECRDEQKKFAKPKIPFWKVIDSSKSFKKKLNSWRREIKKMQKRQ